MNYGLSELTYPSFQRHYGFKCVLSAADVVYAITALLEAPPEVIKRLDVGAMSGGQGDGTTTLVERWLWNKANEAYGDRSGFFLAVDALNEYVLCVNQVVHQSDR